MDRRLAVTIGAAARSARVRARLTQADVAERVGIASEVYGRLERGHMLPSVQTLRKLCDVLQVSADVALGRHSESLPAASSWAAESPPAYEPAQDWRRLLRRLRGLSPRKIRLLSLLASELGR